MRFDQRKNDELRPINIIASPSEHAEGSAIIEFGKTRVLCTATIESNVPKWMQGSDKGWVTAEYGMLPRSTHTRIRRDKAANGGRTQEISRLIGRSLRAAVDMKAIAEKQVIVDCDVLNADGGTRTAAITGGFVALGLAFKSLMAKGELDKNPLNNYVSAVSVGMKENQALLDLCYEEDCQVDTDMNLVLVDSGDFIELQGTAEGAPFAHSHLLQMIEYAQKGCRELFEKQREVLGGDFLELK